MSVASSLIPTLLLSLECAGKLMNEAEGTKRMETKDGYDADIQILTQLGDSCTEMQQGLPAGGLYVTLQQCLWDDTYLHTLSRVYLLVHNFIYDVIFNLTISPWSMGQIAFTLNKKHGWNGPTNVELFAQCECLINVVYIKCLITCKVCSFMTTYQ